MSDTLRATFRRVLRLPNRRAVIRPGRIERIPGFASNILGNTREVTVYLPAGYDEREDVRYPVLYMHDGQNLFDPHRAYVPGNHWRLQEAADAAIGERTARPVIIVGVDHAGPARIDEYTPVKDPKHNGGGRAEDYARFLIEEPNSPVCSRAVSVRKSRSIKGLTVSTINARYASPLPPTFSRWSRNGPYSSSRRLPLLGMPTTIASIPSWLSASIVSSTCHSPT